MKFLPWIVSKLYEHPDSTEKRRYKMRRVFLVIHPYQCACVLTCSHLAVLYIPLRPSALQIINQNLSGPLPIFGPGASFHSLSQLQLSANHVRVVEIKRVIANCAPFSVVKNLHSSLNCWICTNQSNIVHALKSHLVFLALLNALWLSKKFVCIARGTVVTAYFAVIALLTTWHAASREWVRKVTL